VGDKSTVKHAIQHNLYPIRYTKPYIYVWTTCGTLLLDHSAHLELHFQQTSSLVSLRTVLLRSYHHCRLNNVNLIGSTNIFKASGIGAYNSVSKRNKAKSNSTKANNEMAAYISFVGQEVKCCKHFTFGAHSSLETRLTCRTCPVNLVTDSLAVGVTCIGYTKQWKVELLILR